MYNYKHRAYTNDMHKAPSRGVMFKQLHYMLLQERAGGKKIDR